MDQISLPSFDESLYEINYFEIASTVLIKTEFASFKELIDYIHRTNINFLSKSSNPKAKILSEKLESIISTCSFERFQNEDLVKFLCSDFQSKLLDFCKTMNLSNEQYIKLKELIFNYYASKKIEHLLKQQPISKKINDYHKNNQKILNSFNNTDLPPTFSPLSM